MHEDLGNLKCVCKSCVGGDELLGKRSHVEAQAEPDPEAEAPSRKRACVEAQAEPEPEAAWETDLK